MTAGPCVSLAKIRPTSEKPSSATRLAVRGDASLVLLVFLIHAVGVVFTILINDSTNACTRNGYRVVYT
jgi:hypothetical protein